MTALQIESILNAVQAISDEHFGDHTLDAISGAGCIERPKLVLVFINPTHRNISTRKSWKGIKAPWIGCSNIWQLFCDAGLIDERINQEIQAAKNEWSEEFALQVYRHVTARGVYITNIVKWAGLDAKLPERKKIKLYVPLLLEELRLIRPQRIIVFGQLTYEALLRQLGIKDRPAFGQVNETMLASQSITSISTDVGEVIPCYFPVGQGIKNRPKAVAILRLIAAV